MEEETRVKIDEKEQRRIFTKFIKKQNKNFSKASKYLDISNLSLSRYKRCKTRYIPETVLTKAITYLSIEKPRVIERRTLTEIKRENISKSYPVLRKKYGKDWMKVIGQKGIEVLKAKYGSKYYNITLRKGRDTLKEKYGETWQKELSKHAMKALKIKYGNNFENRPSNLKILFKNRKSTESENLIIERLKKLKIHFKTNVIKNNLEFDIVIPDEKNPKYVIEVSDIKPTTYNQRMKILKLYYQKLAFPDAQHIAILRTFAINKNKVYRLQKVIKSFLEKEEIKLFSLENIEEYIVQLTDSIKNKRNITLNEEFRFKIKCRANSKKGCIAQSKKIYNNELRLNKFLVKIGAKLNGPSIFEVNDGFFICMDNFEIYQGKKIAYETTSSNSNNCLRSLAGKILLYKTFNKDLNFVVILDNPKIFNNSSLKFLRDLADAVILKKDINENKLVEVRNSL